MVRKHFGFLSIFLSTMSSPPIFIIGTERSGSNLLRVILTSHSKIWIPHPPHFMNYFAHLDYGDLHKDTTQKRVIKDMCRLVHFHIFPWNEFHLDIDEIQSRVQHPSMFGLTAALYEYVLQQSKKDTQ